MDNEAKRKDTGLLGAALSQYKSSTADSINPQQDIPTNLLKRRSSGGNLMLSSESRTRSFTGERRRAASPLPMRNSRSQLPQDRTSSPKPFPSLLPQYAEPPQIHRPRASKPLMNRERKSSSIISTNSSAGIYQGDNAMSLSSNTFSRNMVRIQVALLT